MSRPWKELVLANVGGNVYALADRCAHMNAPLSMGTLDGTTIICPLHFSRFDVRTGKKISGPVDGVAARCGETPAGVAEDDGPDG